MRLIVKWLKLVIGAIAEETIGVFKREMSVSHYVESMYAILTTCWLVFPRDKHG